MLTLQDVVDDLYRISVTEGKRTSTARLKLLADMCIQQLEVRGILGATKETPVPGIGRNKQWDVAWSHSGRARLAISLKSLLFNISGSVPNRADELMGEMANVQLRSPEIVTGYIMIFDNQNLVRNDGRRWIDFYRDTVKQLSGRQAPAWAAGMVEASAIVEVDFSEDASIVAGQDLNGFFDHLAGLVKERNPGAFDT